LLVASSAATESEKQAQRTWDRSSLLQVDDNDTQVGIFNAYAQKANTDGEGKSTKRGLGAASAPASGRRGGMGMMFVSAGGKPAETAASGGMPSFVGAGGGASYASAGASYAAAGAGSLPPGWVAQLDPCSGAPYYTNLQTGAAQWAPPLAVAAIAPPPPLFATPTPPVAPPLPPGWVAAADPTSGHTYYCNAARNLTQWERPVPAPPEPPPPLPPGQGPPLPPGDPPPPPPAEPNERWRSGQGAQASVRVGGVPPDMSDLDLRELFSRSGTVLSLQVTGSVYSASSMPRTATIRYDAPASAEAAVRTMDGTRLRSHTLKVMMEAQHPRSAAKPY